MKVVVRCVHNRVTKADMEREIERLFQENKDLRVSEGHLRDELNLARQQSSSQDMDTMVDIWKKAVEEKIKAEEQAEEYHIALMESDCRVDECEKRMDWLSKEVLEWKATAEGYKNQYEELKAQKEADDKKSEEICTACNEQYERVLSDRNHLREEVARLTNERDAAVSENTVMTFDLNELRDKWEVERNLRTEYEQRLETELDKTTHWYKKYQQLSEEYNELEADYDVLSQAQQEYGEEIDRLRKAVIELLIASLPMNSLA